MHANKFTGQNFEKEMAMATTLIENIVNELTELVVQKVLEEFNQRIDDVARRLGEMERALAAQPVIDANFVDERIDDELENKGFINEEALQRYLDRYRFVTEGSLIEFINDRVRITVE